MNDYKNSVLHKAFCDSAKHYADADRKLSEERHRSAAQAMYAEAYRQMPADMRQQAELWGVGALMELVWMNGWDCGYRQSVRDAGRAALTKMDAGE